MKRTKKGFTLIELIIVIAILGILAAILVVSFTGVLSGAKKDVDQSTALGFGKAFETSMVNKAQAAMTDALTYTAPVADPPADASGEIIDVLNDLRAKYASMNIDYVVDADATSDFDAITVATAAPANTTVYFTNDNKFDGIIFRGDNGSVFKVEWNNEWTANVLE